MRNSSQEGAIRVPSRPRPHARGLGGPGDRSTSSICSRRSSEGPRSGRTAGGWGGHVAHVEPRGCLAAQRVVDNLEPFRAGLRQGNWKLIWQASLPSRVELFDIAADSAQTTRRRGEEPEVVATLKQRVKALSREAEPPLISGEAMPALKAQLFSGVVLPADVNAVEGESWRRETAQLRSARGESRTRTGLPPVDFEFCAQPSRTTTRGCN